MRAVAVALLVLLPACAPQPPAVELPDLEGWSGEPQVVAKIDQVRRQALEDPESAAANGRLGKVFHGHDLFREAVVCYQRAAEIEPWDVRWPHLAALAIAKVDLEGSLPLFRRAAELGSDQPALYVSFGDVLAQLGRPEEAEARYRTALELDPESTHALYGLGQLALGRGEPEAAGAFLERAAEAAPWHGEVHTLRAQVYQRLGRGHEAELALLRAGAYPEATRAPDPLLAEVEAEAVSSQAFSRRGQRLAGQGRYAEAEVEFRKVLKIRPGDVRDFSNLGGTLTAQGKLEEAVASYRQALTIDPGDTFTLNNLAMALAGQGDFDAAVAHLEKALAIDGTYADAHHNLGLVQARKGKTAQAVEHYRRALEYDPSAAEAHSDLGTALAAQGQVETAVEHWRQAIDIDPRELSAVYNLSLALAQRGEHREAVERLRNGLAIAPNSSRLASLLAWELATAPEAEVRDPEAAETLARRVHGAYPDQPRPADLLAAALAAGGRFDEAVPLAERALARARSTGQAGLAAQIEARLQRYRRGQPFLQEPAGR